MTALELFLTALDARFLPMVFLLLSSLLRAGGYRLCCLATPSQCWGFRLYQIAFTLHVYSLACFYSKQDQQAGNASRLFWYHHNDVLFSCGVLCVLGCFEVPASSVVLAVAVFFVPRGGTYHESHFGGEHVRAIQESQEFGSAPQIDTDLLALITILCIICCASSVYSVAPKIWTVAASPGSYFRARHVFSTCVCLFVLALLHVSVGLLQHFLKDVVVVGSMLSIVNRFVTITSLNSILGSHMFYYICSRNACSLRWLPVAAQACFFVSMLLTTRVLSVAPGTLHVHSLGFLCTFVHGIVDRVHGCIVHLDDDSDFTPSDDSDDDEGSDSGEEEDDTGSYLDLSVITREQRRLRSGKIF